MTWQYSLIVEHNDINCMSASYGVDVWPMREWLTEQLGEEGIDWAFSMGRSVHSHVDISPSRRPINHMVFFSNKNHVILYRLAWGGIVDPKWR